MNAVPSSRRYSAKAILFWGVLTGAVVLVPLLLLETFVWLVGWRTSDDPFLQFGRVSSFFEDTVIDGRPAKAITHRELYRERKIGFSTKKEPGALRVFFLGGSASAGWPQPPAESYSAYLDRALRTAYPNRKLELINVSAHAYAAYRVRLIMQEVLDFDPDLLVIYSGNNEFIEPRRYSTATRWYDPMLDLANRSSVYRLLRGSFIGVRLFPENTLEAEQRGFVAYEQWSKIEELPLALKTDPLQLQKVIEHYEFSISSMVAAAQARGIPVILLTVPVNLRDWEPNVSITPAPDRVEAWRDKYLAGRKALLNGDAATAAAELQRAAEIDPNHADTAYFLGRALEFAGRLDEAYASYDRARDLDANPFRALSTFNDVIRRVAAEHSNVRLVDAEEVVRNASRPYAPGFDLFLDYVHLTTKGNVLLAGSVFDAIVAGKYAGTAPVSGFRRIPASDPERDENRDQTMQWQLLVLAMAMHQYETVVEKARLIAANPGGFKSLKPETGEKAARALTLFTKMVDLERLEIMTGRPSAEKSAIDADLGQLYRDIFGRYEQFRKERTHNEEMATR
jgi:tetratricopeptide (TPR) repeat protein